MNKLKDIEILTKHVYLNIEHEDGTINALNLYTKDAIKQYGDLNVKFVGEPEYFDFDDETRRSRKTKDNRKEGTTVIVLIAED